MALDAFPQIAADLIEVELLGRLHNVARDPGLLHEHDWKALAHDVAYRHCHLADDAAPRGGDDVLHLHRLDDRHLLTGSHLVANRHVDGDDHPLDGRCDPGRPIGPDHVRDFVPRWPRRLLLGFHGRVVLEQGQRIAALHPRPREPRLRARPRQFDIPLPRLDGTRQLGDVVIHPARVNLAGNEIRVGQDVVQKRDVGIDAVDPEFAQRTSGARHRGREIRPGRMRDHLRQKRVECARRAVARIAESIGPYAGSTRRLVRGKHAAAGADADRRPPRSPC